MGQVVHTFLATQCIKLMWHHNALEVIMMSHKS